MAENWQEWKKSFQVYLKENDCNTKSQDLKVYILKENIGKVGLNVIQNIILKNPKDGNDMNILLEKLDDHFKPRESEVKIRYNFFKRSQRKNESIETYIEVLQEIAKKCNFGHLTNSLIRDKVILNIKDEELLKVLMTIEYLDLFKLVVHYNLYNKRKNSETSTKDMASVNNAQVKNIDNENAKATETKKQSEEINKISRTEGHNKKIHSYSKNNNNQVTNTVDKSCKSNSAQFRKNCWKCDQKHPLRCCPAWGFKCGKCGDHNHYTQCCRMYVPKNEEKNMNVCSIIFFICLCSK
ncbi:hypothetical protein WN55_02521 [Dufourea novaeangliae]|uniref:CCHC-type domain-containing protein n=1 Tax=Dufourea novaeangliae TaxID=178035 RepID=A0A154PIX5_DUFNO|nr:hypothetical protein WN55_02521 [Dufourea novaeangliae]